MKKLASFLVRRRRILFFMTLAVTLVCTVLALRVEVTPDMSRYLASDSPMRRGKALLEQAFPDDPEQSAFRFVFTALDESEVPEIRAQMEAQYGVSRVEHVSGDARYEKDGRTLFVVWVDGAYGSDDAERACAELQERFSGYDLAVASNEEQKTDVPLTLLAIGVAIVVVILVLMSKSWIEPLLFLLTIGMAVVINFGTNLVFGYISDITLAIGPVLQLVLSMDYSIILMSRYRERRAAGEEKAPAMRTALEQAFSSITASAFTTVVGLLALSFMTFKIGREIGVVLAKGVFISMLCMFTALPALVLASDGLIAKTAKKTIPLPTRWLAVYSDRARRVIPVVFILMFAAFFYLRQFTPIIFTENLTDDLTPYFPRDNPVVLLYENTDEAAAASLVSELEQNDRVRTVQAYSNTLGMSLSREQMTEAMTQMGASENMGMLVDVIYQAEPGEAPTLTIREFFDRLMTNETVLSNLGQSAPAAFTVMSGWIDDQIAQMRGERWSRVVIQTTYPENSAETTAFMDGLYDRCDREFSGETYLIGTSAMVHEMEDSFSREYLTVSLITAAAIFLVVLLTFRSVVIPLLLVLLVQCGVYLTTTVMGWQGYDVFYLALLIVQGILMGATIDYAIVFSNYYREKRRTMGRFDALCGAYADSIHTIMTSGLILIIVTAAIAQFCPTPSIAQVCATIALGTTSAVLLILLVLPGMLAAFDRLVAKDAAK